MSLQIGYLMDKLYNMDKNLGGTAAMSREILIIIILF
jgi:hypothetical protein